MPIAPKISPFSKISAPDSSKHFGDLAVSPSVMLVSHIEEDQRFVDQISCQNRWTLFRAGTVRAAFSLVRDNHIPIVISDRDVPGGGWKKMLSALQRLARPPLLVVASRLADEHLWAEALNLGAHDVLATPFSATELVWVLGNAWHRSGLTLGGKARAAACAAGL